jgi:hypothetical protein
VRETDVSEAGCTPAPVSLYWAADSRPHTIAAPAAYAKSPSYEPSIHCEPTSCSPDSDVTDLSVSPSLTTDACWWQRQTSVYKWIFISERKAP